MKVDGSCHCGAVTFEADIDPEAVRICHCTDCQSLSGTAFRVNVHTPAGKFRLLTGTPKVYIKTADNGNKRAQGFCGDCGASLYSTEPGEAKAYGLRVGALRQRAQLTPVRQVWHRSALPWVAGIAQVPSIEKQ